MSAETQYFSSSQGRIAFAIAGAGPDLVLVHGTPAWSHVWQRVVATLRDRWRIFTYDLAGYGRSDKVEGQDVRLRTQARVLSELLRHWGLEAPRLVGHDFGAATVLGAHLVEGSPAGSIVIADGVVLNPWGTPYSLLVKDNARLFEQIPSHVHEATLAAHLRTAVSRHLTDEALAPLLAPWLDPEGQKAYYRQIAQYDQDYTGRLEALYPRIAVPLRVLWGAEDRWIAPDEGERFRALVPGASLTLVPDAGHFLMLDCPNAVAQLIDGAGT